MAVSPASSSCRCLFLLTEIAIFVFVFPITFTHSAQFGQVQVLGQVTSSQPDENSGLAASRVHPNVLYGHNDHGDTSRIFAFDPNTGAVLATIHIDGATNTDWEDICVGTCGGSQANESCLYIGDIGDGNGRHPRTVYKVMEPPLLEDGSISVVETYRFTWSEADAESLMVDPQGNLYVISKASGGEARFAPLPAAGWQSSSPVTVTDQGSVLLHLHTAHRDPQGGDLSSDGLSLLVKTEEGILFYEFATASDYAQQLSHMTPTVVSTYVRRPAGEAVAWNPQGTGFYTLPEGLHPTFHFYTFSHGGSVIG